MDEGGRLDLFINLEWPKQLNINIGHLTLQVLDFWHPYEKAAYPEYFARREVRKREFVERWEKKYGQKVDFGHEWK